MQRGEANGHACLQAGPGERQNPPALQMQSHWQSGRRRDLQKKKEKNKKKKSCRLKAATPIPCPAQPSLLAPTSEPPCPHGPGVICCCLQPPLCQLPTLLPEPPGEDRPALGDAWAGQLPSWLLHAAGMPVGNVLEREEILMDVT